MADNWMLEWCTFSFVHLPAKSFGEVACCCIKPPKPNFTDGSSLISSSIVPLFFLFHLWKNTVKSACANPGPIACPLTNLFKYLFTRNHLKRQIKINCYVFCYNALNFYCELFPENNKNRLLNLSKKT